MCAIAADAPAMTPTDLTMRRQEELFATDILLSDTTGEKEVALSGTIFVVRMLAGGILRHRGTKINRIFTSLDSCLGGVNGSMHAGSENRIFPMPLCTVTPAAALSYGSRR
jgi:hypothetical protein